MFAFIIMAGLSISYLVGVAAFIWANTRIEKAHFNRAERKRISRDARYAQIFRGAA